MAYNPMMYFPQPPITYQQPRMIEVVPVDTVEDGAKIQVQVGGSVLAIAKDDSFIVIKSVGMNGQDSVNVFDKRPPAPPAPVFDPAAYVTKDELEARLAAIKPVRKEAEK